MYKPQKYDHNKMMAYLGTSAAFFGIFLIFAVYGLYWIIQSELSDSEAAFIGAFIGLVSIMFSLPSLVVATFMFLRYRALSALRPKRPKT